MRALGRAGRLCFSWVLLWYPEDKRGKKKSIFEELQMLLWKMSGPNLLLRFQFLFGETFVFPFFPILRVKAALRSQSLCSSLYCHDFGEELSYVAAEVTKWQHSRGRQCGGIHEREVPLLGMYRLSTPVHILATAVCWIVVDWEHSSCPSGRGTG